VIAKGPDRPGGLDDAGATLDEVAGVLAGARSALFITGAGMSADSGLPTYRGVGGLYDAAEPEDGIPIEILLSGDMMASRPELTWKYLCEIERACRGARPHRGHEILAALERRLDHSLVLTQNVDGLHRAAGSVEVVEIHGNLHRLRCTRCAWLATVADFDGLAALPRCPTCDAVARPDVVLFGEVLAMSSLARLDAALGRGVDVVFSIGTSSLFPYIMRPVWMARRQGIPTVEINPGTTDLSEIVEYRIRSGARDALVALWERYEARKA